MSVLALGVVYVVQHTAASKYSERCSLYALALATTSTSWLSPTAEIEDHQLPYSLLALGVVYVRVHTSAGVVLDLRRPQFEQAQLPTPDPAAVLTVITVSFGGQLAVDVVIPQMIQGLTAEEDFGTLQFGIDATGLRIMNRRIAAIASATVFAAWSVITLALTFAAQIRSRGRSRQQGPAAMAEDAARRIVVGKLVLCLDQLNFTIDGISIDVTPKQAAVMELMMTHPGRAFSDADILAQVWKTSPYANSSDVKQQIYLIRKRLRAAGVQAAKVLVTVPGVGYKLVPSAVDAFVDAASTDNPRP